MKTGKIITSFIAGAVTGWFIKSMFIERRNSFKYINQKRVNTAADYYMSNQRSEPTFNDELPDSKDIIDNYQEEYLK